MGGKSKGCAPGEVTVCLDRRTAENLFYRLSVALGTGAESKKSKNGKGGKGKNGKNGKSGGATPQGKGGGGKGKNPF